MTRRTLILKSLRHHARAHLGTLLGAVVASAVLIGALVVGDSVRFSLRQQALNRLGDIHLAVVQHDRYFRAALADELELGEGVAVAPILRVSASAVAGKGERAATRRARAARRRATRADPAPTRSARNSIRRRFPGIQIN